MSTLFGIVAGLCAAIAFLAFDRSAHGAALLCMLLFCVFSVIGIDLEGDEE